MPLNKKVKFLAQEVPELQTVGVCEIFWIIPQQVCVFLLFFPGSQLWRQLVWASGGVTLFSGDSKQGLDFFCWISFAGDGTRFQCGWCFLGGTSLGLIHLTIKHPVCKEGLPLGRLDVLGGKSPPLMYQTLPGYLNSCGWEIISKTWTELKSAIAS